MTGGVYLINAALAGLLFKEKWIETILFQTGPLLFKQPEDDVLTCFDEAYQVLPTAHWIDGLLTHILQ